MDNENLWCETCFVLFIILQSVNRFRNFRKDANVALSLARKKSFFIESRMYTKNIEIIQLSS